MLEEADPAGIQVCVELIRTPNGTGLVTAADATIKFSTGAFAGFATVNGSASSSVIMTFPTGSMPGASRCLDLVPIQDNITLIAEKTLTIELDDFSEDAVVPVDTLEIAFVDDDRGTASFTNSTVLRVREDVGSSSFCYNIDSVGVDGISGSVNLMFFSQPRTAASKVDYNFAVFATRQEIVGAANATSILERPTFCVTFTIVDDIYPEYEETFSLIPYTFDGFAFPGGADEVLVIIEDDDRVNVALVTFETSAEEGYGW